MISLAMFTTRCRSAVERDSYQAREIQLIPGAESPSRIVKVYSLLLRGLLNIGISKQRAWELIERVANSSMPALRATVLNKMFESPKLEYTTPGLAESLGYPSNTVRFTLQDMACYGVVNRNIEGKGKSDIWSLSDWTIQTYNDAFIKIEDNLTQDSAHIVSSDNSSNINSKTLQTDSCVRSEKQPQFESKNSDKSDTIYTDFYNTPDKCPICQGKQFSWIDDSRYVCVNKCNE